jgi:hypothetical protein
MDGRGQQPANGEKLPNVSRPPAGDPKWEVFRYEIGNDIKGNVLLPEGDSWLKEHWRTVAREDEHVLITGETGTGKEELAKLIAAEWLSHKGHPASKFQIVNCTTLGHENNMINSTLFGHKKGAFTGADDDRPGILVKMDGGTLVLDEIGELPVNVQAKLLRFMQDGWIWPVGYDEPQTQVKVRLVAATNAEVGDKTKFRADLYQRFQYKFNLRPLRERPNDILRLLALFFEPYGTVTGIELSSLVKVLQYEWPGNIRELRSACTQRIQLNQNRADAMCGALVDRTTDSSFTTLVRYIVGRIRRQSSKRGIDYFVYRMRHMDSHDHIVNTLKVLVRLCSDDNLWDFPLGSMQQIIENNVFSTVPLRGVFRDFYGQDENEFKARSPAIKETDDDRIIFLPRFRRLSLAGLLLELIEASKRAGKTRLARILHERPGVEAKGRTIRIWTGSTG